MQAMVIRAHGAPEVFESAELDPPALRPGYLRVQVRATSVNPVDCKIRALGLPIGPDLPAVLHGDVAGVVVEVGEGVVGFAPGDRVFGCAGGVKGEAGALAELMDCDAALVAPLPEELDFAQGAALALVSITAWEGLVEKARVGAGQTVLVHAGAGGVGHVAVQIAKARGAEVFATVSSDAKAEIARQLGATPINYRAASIAEYVQRHTDGIGFDVVYDTIGGDNIPRAWKAARANGLVICCQSNSTQDMTPVHLKGLTHAGVLMLIPLLSGRDRARHGRILEAVAALASAGLVTPLLDPARFALAEVAAAHRRWEAGEAVGKIVISVGD